MHLLLLRLALHRIHPEAPGVQSLYQLPDLQSLAGSSEALKGDHHRDVQLLASALQLSEAPLQMLHLLFILFLSHLLCEIQFF